MKKITSFFLFVLVSGLSFSQSSEWPKEMNQDGSVLTIYQPQVENWSQYQNLDFRMAFSLLPAQENTEIVGVVYLQGITTVNMDTHVVSISQLKIEKTYFPSLNSSDSAKYAAIVNSFLSSETTHEISLEQIVACTPKPSAPAAGVSVNNSPAEIFVSMAPAILLQTEGKPILYSADNADTSLKLLINANWPVFYSSQTSFYYIYDDLEWQHTSSLTGKWAFTSDLPAALNQLSGDSAFSNLKNAFPAPIIPTNNMPVIFFAESPAELMLFNGQPTFTAIPGTSLQYANNTESAVFYYITKEQYYYLVSGRWFSSQSLYGPWTYATANLPSDFQKIPLDSPAAVVLSSVPGTDEAANAVMIAQIPNVKTVNPDVAQQVTVVYTGAPVFEPIKGTTMSYAVNTPEKVIELSSNSYYLCDNAIWFTSNTPNGPWVIASSVPQVIYTIPSSSPVYNVTYVTQVTTTSGSVQSSSTAGYMGAFIVGAAVGATIVMGTGYYYPPYYYHPPYGYPVCYPYPCTYGAYAYHPYPYYGGSASTYYNSATGAYGRSTTAYSPYGSETVAQGYNPSTGTYARGASVSSPYGTASAAQAYNPYTGAAASTRQESNAYGSAGTSVATDGHGQFVQTAHETTSQGTVAAGQTSTGGKAVAASGENNSAAAVKTSTGNMYASANGNVYKNTDGSWSQLNNSGSQAASHSTTSSQQAAMQSHEQSGEFSSESAQSSQLQQLNKEAQSRQTGAMQSQQFSQARSGSLSGGFSGGASGFHGGGAGFSGGRR